MYKFLILFVFFSPLFSYGAVLDSYTGSQNNYCFVAGYTGDAEVCGASFFLDADATIETINITARKSGSPTGTLKVNIYAHGTSTPTGAPLETSSTRVASDLATSFTSYGFDFTDACLESGQYWYVVDRTQTNDFTDTIHLATESSNPNPSSTLTYADSGSWKLGSGDVMGWSVIGTEGECFIPPTEDISATSTVNQTQQNTFNGFALFLATMFFVVWIFKKR